MDLETWAREALSTVDWQALTANAAAVVVALVVAMLVLHAIRRRRPLAELRSLKPSRIDRVLTFVGAGMASAMATYTLWLVIGEMPAWLKWFTVTFFEVNTVAAALRSRRFRLLHAESVEALLKADPCATAPARGRDIDGLAVWIIAAGSSLLGVAEAHSDVERIVRTAAPLIAAFSWERGLIGELRHYATATASTIKWVNPVEALAVRLGLARPSARYQSVDAADRARRLGLVIDAGYRAGVDSRLPFKLNLLADAIAAARYYRRLRTLQRHYGFGPELLREVRLGVAALRQARDAVSNDNLAHLDPWGDPDADAKAAAAAQAELARARAAAEQAAALHARELAAMRAESARSREEAERMTATARDEVRAVREEAERARHNAQLDLLRSQVTTARTAVPAAKPRSRQVRVPTTRPVSPAGPRDPYVTYAGEIAAVQAGIGDWRTRREPISQGDVKTHAGVGGVPTQRKIKNLIEAMADSGSPDRDPDAARAWLVGEGLLPAAQTPPVPQPA